MKKLFLVLIAVVLAACATVPPTPTPPPAQIVEPAAPPVPCEPQVIRGEQVNIRGNIIVFGWVDQDCDGKCDGVFVARYLGTFEGEPAFELVAILPCDEAEEALKHAQEQARKFGINA